MIKNHEYWMEVALSVAQNAMINNELPIASVLVAGNSEIGRGSTLTYSKDSPIAHGELFVLLKAKKLVYTCERPLILYTTLEPCIMCLGAAIECGVDEIVYGMEAKPDGGVCYTHNMLNVKEKIPKITRGILSNQAIFLMNQFVKEYPGHPGWSYAKSLL